ncbi:biopolymer transporter ExbD [bacterium]|nr:biopolymer transporter ExbD [bacterium]
MDEQQLREQQLSEQKAKMDMLIEANIKYKKFIRKLKRQRAAGGLGMNSLMDILTILLIFLLKSFSSKADAIQMSDELELPKSSGILKLERSIRVYVTKNSIKVEGDSKKRSVKIINGTIDPTDMVNGDAATHVIAELKDILEEKAEYLKNLERESNGRREFKGLITIISDRSIPFRIINDVVFTAAISEFKNVKFAVIQGG